MQEIFMQKTGIVVRMLAEIFISMEIGDRLPTIDILTKKLGIARGTVQQSITKLKQYQAIDLQAHGHLGTFIEGIDYKKLMEICANGNIAGIMPLPYSKRYEGLATGIHTVLNDDTGVAANMAFMGGAKRRIQAMLDGRYNFAIMSLTTAQHYIDDGYDIEIAEVLSKNTYVNTHTLIMSKGFKGEPKRIGVDTTSFDQLSMTTSYFENKEIEMVFLKYAQIIENIKNKNIDAAIWSLEENILNDDDLVFKKLSNGEDEDANSRVAIVLKKQDDTTRYFFKRFFDAKKVEEIQKSVQLDEIMPNY